MRSWERRTRKGRIPRCLESESEKLYWTLLSLTNNGVFEKLRNSTRPVSRPCARKGTHFLLLLRISGHYWPQFPSANQRLAQQYLLLSTVISQASTMQMSKAVSSN